MSGTVSRWPQLSLGGSTAIPPALEIAVLIPCYNEELTVGKVIGDFREQLPTATIYVFDNNSTDRTAAIARAAGAVVICERRQGKGFVVQSMFRMVDADVYVMVDGDDTYPAADVHRLIQPILHHEAEMVVGSRLHLESQSAFQRLNRWGNRAFLTILNTIFHVRLTDILSGYRAFSRTFVRTVVLVGGGFEVETELTIKTLEAGFRLSEVSVDLGRRPAGSFSKIQVFRDGMRILSTIFALFRDYKPLAFFGTVAIALIGGGLVSGSVVVLEFLQTGRVLHIPLTILSVGLVLLGTLSLMVGVILHCLGRRIREVEFLIRCAARLDVPLGRVAERRQAG